MERQIIYFCCPLSKVPRVPRPGPDRAPRRHHQLLDRRVRVEQRVPQHHLQAHSVLQVQIADHGWVREALGWHDMKDLCLSFLSGRNPDLQTTLSSLPLSLSPPSSVLSLSPSYITLSNLADNVWTFFSLVYIKFHRISSTNLAWNTVAVVFHSPMIIWWGKPNLDSNMSGHKS